MSNRNIEREEKWDVPVGFAIPDLGAVLPARATLRTERVHLSSTYFDTPRRDLLEADVSLRRRTGDTDTGWQAKLASRTGSRIEITEPLHTAHDEDVTPPAAITGLLAGLQRGRELRPIAIVRTERIVHSIHDEFGILLLELADDTVHSTAIGDSAEIRAWREVEVELKHRPEKLLRRVGKALERAGATPRLGSSKLARALGADGDAAPPAVIQQGIAPQPATDPITGYLAQQYRDLVAGDLDLRAERNAVHPTRVACRRIRSTLRVFAPVLVDVDPALDAEVAWYAALLGEVRDVQVMREHFRHALADVPIELELGPVAARISMGLDELERDGFTRLRSAMESTRYFALLDSVQELVERQLTIKGRRRKQVQKLVEKADRKFDRRLRAALRSPDDDAALHRARKSAKRARYAYEAAAPAGAKRRVRQFKRLQETLGNFQDAVVAKQLLRTWATATAGRADENGFTFGLLWQRADETQRAVRRSLRGGGS
ncbi:CHAD domain-containing protein [Jatrophihabitans sp. GAS493]|uniref:CYTH and CHAD domain-containing protein n=1 Tax=Jatrophihabitans sp. GAS493 TaxID=1907575 RepID=UPI000BB88904|nr:CYTH and CHAD domain-containing protein [Jatrophihabitans sp. GAS493]SOD74934.1 CHAD domain-containing protein [Jatrophihabitans sp. GAS493]